MLKQLWTALSLALLALAMATAAHAAVLVNGYMTMTDPRSAQSGVTHDFYWRAQGTTVGSIGFQYCTTPSGTCSDSGATGASASISVLTDGGADILSGWEEEGADGWDGGTYTWEINATGAAESTVANNLWHAQFTSFQNPTLGSCNFTGDGSTGACYVRIVTYSDTALATSVDDTTVAIVVTQAVTVSARVDPTFTLIVEGTAGTGQTVNGTTLTNGVTTTVTTIPFANLTAGTPKYASQLITVTGNNPSGYNVVADMTAKMVGGSYGDDIDGFSGNSATTTSAAAWLEPTGTTSGTDTGWLGVGTDDTAVSGQGSNVFFTLDTTGTIVAESTGPATSRESNVVYGIEVNAYQQSDNYTGTLLYFATAIF